MPKCRKKCKRKTGGFGRTRKRQQNKNKVPMQGSQSEETNIYKALQILPQDHNNTMMDSRLSFDTPNTPDSRPLKSYVTSIKCLNPGKSLPLERFCEIQYPHYSQQLSLDDRAWGGQIQSPAVSKPCTGISLYPG